MPHKHLKPNIGLAGLVLLALLACGPLDRLQQLNNQQRAAATGAALLSRDAGVLAAAFEKLNSLPGYRLESRHLSRDPSGQAVSLVVITQTDVQGNIHRQSRSSDGPIEETFVVNGRAYRFDPHYSGWVDAGAAALPEPVSTLELAYLLTQVGAVPAQTSPETIQGRAATRYRLAYVATELGKLFGLPPANPSPEVRGQVWVDNETGALLKAEILVYGDASGQPGRELALEVSRIGRVAPIEAPAPVVNPTAVVAATATAQAATALAVSLTYKDSPVNFELAPLEARQTPASSPRRVELELEVRALPAPVFKELEPFLAQLGQALTLGLPRRNLIVTSSGYRLLASRPTERTVKIVVFFNADVEDFSHVELAFSGRGNPLYAPVPVNQD
jgi:hypothetical protein